MKLLSNWRQAWRWWSVRVSAFGAALFALLLAAPDQLLTLWLWLPPELQAMVPNAPELGLILMLLTAIARVVRQEAPDDE